MEFFNKKIFNISFNQDKSCFCVATECGFIVFDLDDLHERFHRLFEGGLSIATIHNKTNLVMISGGGNPAAYPPNKAILWNDNDGGILHEFEFKTDVKNIKLSEKNIIIVLENLIYIYNFNNLKFKKKIKTGPNPNGLCDINYNLNYSSNDKKDENVTEYLICPGLSEGLLRIINLDENNGDKLIQAHQNPLNSISISNFGKYIATASEQGTLVRVFDRIDCKEIKEFRRGTNKVNTYSITFSENENNICVLSDKGTLHIFKLFNNNTYSNFYFMSNFVPLLSSEWSSYQYVLPDANNTKYHIKFESNLINVIGENGTIYKLFINEEKNCIEQHNKYEFFKI
jgi:WD40 repeat protein